jgi:hypothetical protein
VNLLAQAKIDELERAAMAGYSIREASRITAILTAIGHLRFEMKGEFK